MKNITNQIDPKIDSFITTTLADYKQYHLTEYMQAHLTYFLYILLNKDFQSFLIRCRTILDIPRTGFSSQSEYDLWRKRLDEDIEKYGKGEAIERRFVKVISQMDKKRRNLYEVKGGGHHSFIAMLLKDLKVDDVFFGVWFMFLANVLFIANPQMFLRNLKAYGRRKWQPSVYIAKNTLLISLNSRSTINSIKATIDKNKNTINESIRTLKHKVRENAIEVKELERDYAIYKSYISHNSTKKRGEDAIFNERKEIYVMDDVETVADIGDLDFGSIRKIVSRMNKRIKNTYSDKLPMFNAALDEIESSSPSVSRT